MKLNDDLKLVLDVGDYKAYHSPISTDLYEANFLVLSGVQSSLFSRGIKYAAGIGPRIATLSLKDEGARIAQDRDQEGDYGVSALLADIKRLTTVLVPGQNGWDFLTVDAAINQNKIDLDDWKEAESEIVFFTCAFFSAARKERENILPALIEIIGADTTALSCEAYANSFTMPSEEKTGKRRASSVPV